MEIRPDDDMAQTQPLDDDPAGEGRGRKLGQRAVEVQFVEQLDADLLQPVRPRLGPGQAEGRRVRGEDLARVRLEGQHAERRADLRPGCPREVDHRLVAQVDTVEIADGGAGAAVGVRDVFKVAQDPHGPKGYRRAGGGARPHGPVSPPDA